VPDEARVTRVLDVCARPECIERVHATLAELWEDVPEIDPGQRMRFELAVAEIAANIVEHSAGPGEGAVDLNLRLSAFPDRVEARFRDTGREALVDVAGAALPTDEAEHGRGIAMALAAVDEVAYLREDGQNVWRVVQQHG
jgi:serine/threonine-protein kinase RsbW